MLVAEARAYDDIARISNYIQNIASDTDSIAKSLKTLVKILEEKK